MGLTLVTAPISEPLTVQEVKTHLRIDYELGTDVPSLSATQDDYLTALIAAARTQCEHTTKRRLITQQWQQTLDWWPLGITFRVLCPPVQSVQSVQYYDQNSVLQTLDTASYEVSLTQQQARISLLNGYWWPTLRIMKLDPVVINMTCGYGDDASKVPQQLKQAMLLMIGHWYNQREDVIFGTQAMMVPKAADYLMAPYKVWEF